MSPKAADIAESPPRQADDLAIVLPGGGARAAYQVGLLRCLSRYLPETRFPIITGVSAGAINAAFLAAHRGSLRQASSDLTELWSDLEISDVLAVDGPWLAGNAIRWGSQLLGGGAIHGSAKGLVDVSPLRSLLARRLGAIDDEIPGIERNVESGRLKAVALTAVNYSTGRTVTFLQGRDLETWERPQRRSETTRLTIDHIMASSALPVLFPAVRLGKSWYGDGGIRLAAPFGPAVHLGANRILAISTRYDRTVAEASQPSISGYPPLAQILGHLLNAAFLDVLDNDLAQLERLNRVLRRLPPEKWEGFRPLQVLVLRPSQDLGRLAAEYEFRLPSALRFLTRGLGTRDTTSPDFLSMILFQADYLKRMIEIGEADAEARRDEIMELVLGGKEQ